MFIIGCIVCIICDTRRFLELRGTDLKLLVVVESEVVIVPAQRERTQQQYCARYKARVFHLDDEEQSDFIGRDALIKS